MSEHDELKKAAEACKDLMPLRYMQSQGGSLSIRNDHGIVFGVHQNRSFPAMMKANKAHADLMLAATPDVILGLIDGQSGKITLSGCELSLRDLIEGVVRNVQGPSKYRNKYGSPRWALVRDAFGTGSGVATALCREFGYDPDEYLRS